MNTTLMAGDCDDDNVCKGQRWHTGLHDDVLGCLDDRVMDVGLSHGQKQK